MKCAHVDLLFSIALVAFQRKTIGTHTTVRLLTQKLQNASQFSCDQKNGLFLGDLHPRPDVFIPITEQLCSFQMASANPQITLRLLGDDFNLHVKRQAGLLYRLFFCSPSQFVPEIRPSLQMAGQKKREFFLYNSLSLLITQSSKCPVILLASVNAVNRHIHTQVGAYI